MRTFYDTLVAIVSSLILHTTMADGEEVSKPAGLFSQLQSFNKSSLKKTETAITTEDGKKMLETHDSCGNYNTTVTNRAEYGFVPDLCLDLQVGEILPGLILTSQDVAAEWGILEQYKVTHILNVASYVRNYFPDKITYRNLKLNDTIDQPILPAFPPAFEFIDEGRKAGCVLVHCNAGVSRAASICIGYLMRTEGMNFMDAYQHVKSRRSKINPNAGFKYQMEFTYQNELNAKRDIS